MTLGEFKLKFGHLPDDTPIALCVSDGTLDYATFGWGAPEGEVIVVAGN